MARNVAAAIAIIALLIGAGAFILASRPVVVSQPEVASSPSACAAGNHLTRVVEDSAGAFTLTCVPDTPSLNNSTSIIVNHDASGYTANCQTCIYARYAAVFDGATSYVTISDSSTLKPTGDFAFAWDAQISSAVANEVLFIKATGGGTGVKCAVNGGNNALRCTIFALDLDAPVFDTAWHCYVLSRSGTTITFYQDGATTSGTQGNDQSTTTALIIGAQSAVPANPFNGRFADFAYYNQALSSTQAAQFCNQHTNIPTTNLNLWTSFNVRATPATFVDMTGNLNHGTPTAVTQIWDNNSPKVYYSP